MPHDKNITLPSPHKKGGNFRAIDDIKVSDITMVICLRAYDGNPWVLERLNLLNSYYDPSPKIVILDFGSDGEFKEKIENICVTGGMKYAYIDDKDTYSAAIARNRGFESTETEFVFFNDIDCFMRRDFFSSLSSAASALKAKKLCDHIMMLPVYHLSEKITNSFLESFSQSNANTVIDSIFSEMYLTPFNRDSESFIAPYSNVFLMHRNFFHMIGGYNEEFRGHGSEDFEFLIRCLIHQNFLPTPKAIKKDFYGPLQESFFSTNRDYEGFRAYLEAGAHLAESFSLRAFHLCHPRGNSGNEWRENNDWKRKRFSSALDVYIGDEHNLLRIDFLKREKKAICICKHTDTWGYFLPLRILGFKIIPHYGDSSQSIKELINMIINNEIDTLCIFNPYMKSHTEFLPVTRLARENGIKVVVLERGALPNSLYCADDVAYNSIQFSEESFHREVFSDIELSSAEKYMEEIRVGESTLESMDSYEETFGRYEAISHLKSKVIFIPTQMEEDMAVTMFTDGFTAYQKFIESIKTTILKNKDIFFIIKPHPLSKDNLDIKSENVFIADRRDNIHCIIDLSDAVVCYNSGVGLLSILHEKPTITIGNAYYNINNCGYRATSVEDAVDRVAMENAIPPQKKNVCELAAWFVFRKYSFFIAQDNVREFSNRFAHGYKKIQVTQFTLDGKTLNLGRLNSEHTFSYNTYIGRKIYRKGSSTSSVSAPSYSTKRSTGIRCWMGFVIYRHLYSAFLSQEQTNRLHQDPVSFFLKARFWFSRLGRFLFLVDN